MAALTNTQISVTYVGLLKTSANTVLSATAQQITDGSGNNTIMYLSTAGVGIGGSPTAGKELDVTGNVLITGDLQVDNINIDANTISATSGVVTLQDGTIATTQSQGDNSTKLATTAYVDAAVTAEDLDFAGGSGTGSVDLDSQTFTIAGTSNEIETSASGQTLTIGLPDDVTITGELTVSGTGQSSFGGQVTIPATPSASTDAASKGYVDSQVGANNELSEVLANGNTTGGTDISVSSGDDITFADSSKAIFGAGSDLQIFHNEVDSYSAVIDSGTGYFLIGTDGPFILFGNSTATETYIKANNNGSVDLYYDNSAKLATTSSGVTVTGDVLIGTSTTTPSTHYNNLVIEDVAGNNVGISLISGTGNNTALYFGDSADTDIGQIKYSHSSNDMFFVTNATTALTIDSSQNATFAGNVKLTDEKILGLRNASSDYALQYRDLDFRLIGSADSSTQRKFSFGYYTSDNPAGTWNGKAYINSYTGDIESNGTLIDLDSSANAFINIDRGGTSNNASISWRNAGSSYFSAGIETTNNDLFSLLHTCGNGLYFNGATMTFGFGRDPETAITLPQGNSATNKISWYDVSDTFAASIYGSSSTDKLTFATKNSSNVETIALEIDVSQNSTFSGKILASTTTNGIELNQSSVGAATYYVMDNTVETGGKRYRFGYTGGSADKGSFSIYNETDALMPLLISGANSTFAGNVGINQSSPTNKIHAVAASAITDTSILRLSGGETGFSGSNDADIEHSIIFDACAYSAASGIVQRDAAKIAIEKEGSWNESDTGGGTDASLVFSTNNGTIASPNLAERMRISSGGSIFMNNTSAISVDRATLDVTAGGTTNFALQLRGTSNGADNTTTTDAIRVVTNDENNWAIAHFNASAYRFGYQSSGIDYLEIDTSGNVNVAKPYLFVGTQVADNGTTYLTLRNYDSTLVDQGDVQNMIRMTGRYWSGATSQLVETRISSIKDTSNGNGGSALGFSTQTGGDSPVERMRIDKDGIVSFGAALSNAPTTRGRLILNGAGGISTTSGIEFHTSSGGGAGYGSRIFGDGDMSLFIATRANSSTWLKRASFKYYSRFSNSGSFIYGSGYNFHEFNNDSGNQPIAVFAQASGSGSHYGINVINNDDENDTTSRFFMGQGGSTERIKIFSNGNIQNSNNSYGQLSDIKLKENVTDATDKLDELMQVQIKNFNYIGEEQKQIGVIAQEIEQIFPSLVYETPETEYQKVDKTDEEGNIIYQTEQVLVSEAVEGQEAIEWEDKPTMDNTKVEIQEWLDDNNIEWQSADTKQELLDRIPEYKQEAVEAQDAVYETRETDIPETENLELPTGEVTKAVKYSVLVPIMIKAMQEQQEIINDLKARIENLEN